MMLEYQQRVVEEKAELDKKIEKLGDFVEGEVLEKHDLKFQLNLMVCLE